MSDETLPKSDIADSNYLLNLKRQIKDEIYKKISKLLGIWLCLSNVFIIWLIIRLIPSFRDIYFLTEVNLPAVSEFIMSKFGLAPAFIVLILGAGKEFFYKNPRLTLRLNIAYMVAIVITFYIYWVGLFSPIINMQQSLQS